MIRPTAAFRLIPPEASTEQPNFPQTNRPLTPPEGSPEEADFLETGRRVLTGIPGVEDFTISRQTSPKSEHRFQFAMTFADQAVYDAYNVHPDHMGFVQ